MASKSISGVPSAEDDIYFGKEVVNRVSFLREDSEFISNSAFHPSTRFIFYNDGNPLVNKEAKEKLVILTNGSNQLTNVEGDSVAGTSVGLLGNEAWKSILDTWTNDNKEQLASLRDDNKPTFLFLGLKDESVGLDLRKLKCEDTDSYLDHQGRYFGIPYFGIDLTNSPQVVKLIKEHIVDNNVEVDIKNLFFTHSRKHTLGFSSDESALFSHGKMYFDWLGRNRFCPGCGSKVIPVHAGGKLKCTNEESTGEGEEKEYKCPVRNTRVSNVSFPRTDAVVITAITNKDRSKILLSLNKRYAFTKMYSCTAGFMEPSETVEVATKREIWEETGVVCSDIQILMTQPWPFPGNLMIGCVATVDFNGVNEVIHLGHDRELADARWFDISFVRKLVNGEHDELSNPEGIILPNDISVAFTLIKHVLDKGELKL
ncbi:CIC11C00000003241 [Sungouiella intermedia]|uniref:NAD(+) diphosphatase n=1 Tax=Sungouiella intermedia TaxID=45354 RepID=A0A1L0DE25_9ASCO|nr:CIC11C00000003241 [[Candida] intermedia]